MTVTALDLSLAAFIQPWRGTACRHIPDIPRYDILDTRFAGIASTNRWNAPGEPTFYLASDRGVLIAEFARHLDRDFGLPSSSRTASVQPRRIYDLDLGLTRVVDLRASSVRDLLALPSSPDCFLDRKVTRAVAGYLRRGPRLEAVLAPSVAFLDDPDRWILVLFLEQLADGLTSIVHHVVRDGLLQVIS